MIASYTKKPGLHAPGFQTPIPTEKSSTAVAAAEDQQCGRAERQQGHRARLGYRHNVSPRRSNPELIGAQHVVRIQHGFAEKDMADGVRE